MRSLAFIPRFLMFVACLVSVPGILAFAESESYVVRVVGVPDGDRLKIVSDDGQEYVALYGVEQPAEGTFAEEAKAFCEKLVLERDVRIEVRARLGGVKWVTVRLPSGHSLNEELLMEGLAEWDRLMAPGAIEFRTIEAQAKSAGSGMWGKILESRPVIPDLPVEMVLVPKRLHPGPGRIAEAKLVRGADGTLTLVARGRVRYDPGRKAEIQSQIAQRRARSREAALESAREREANWKQLELEADEADKRAHERRMRDLREEELARRINRGDRSYCRPGRYVYRVPFFPVHRTIVVKKNSPEPDCDR